MTYLDQICMFLFICDQIRANVGSTQLFDGELNGGKL